jgi:hypothetical protein
VVLEDQITIGASGEVPHKQNRRGRRRLPSLGSDAEHFGMHPKEQGRKFDLFVHENVP